MLKKRRHKAFWSNFKFKYKLTIINENTLEEVIGLRVSKLNGVSVLLTTLGTLFLIAALIISFTPLRNYLPGYMNSEVRAQIVKNALKVDSLQQLVEQQNLYIMNIQDIFNGKVKADTVKSISSLTTLRKDSLIGYTEREAKFRKEYEESEKYNLTNSNVASKLEGMIFYRPVKGMITQRFGKNNLGITLASSPKDNILSVLDGTVLLSTYTAESGYIIEVQHNQDFVSVYKNCGSLLKREGENVKGGEVIALTAQPNRNNDKLPSRFELWHKGKAVDPEHYIIFK
ncbi:M23 family metallopeptidase [Bacteroidaceae bacterium HV4-6-C5C]|nr:M23 family metallopeptidase [Bacteroidaceae bacterium HV4-6-C5C]